MGCNAGLRAGVSTSVIVGLGSAGLCSELNCASPHIRFLGRKCRSAVFRDFPMAGNDGLLGTGHSF